MSNLLQVYQIAVLLCLCYLKIWRWIFIVTASFSVSWIDSAAIFVWHIRIFGVDPMTTYIIFNSLYSLPNNLFTDVLHIPLVSRLFAVCSFYMPDHQNVLSDRLSYEWDCKISTISSVSPGFADWEWLRVLFCSDTSSDIPCNGTLISPVNKLMDSSISIIF